MFVLNQRFRRNLKSIFNNKPPPKGSYRESAATPILDRWFSPKGGGAYKTFRNEPRKETDRSLAGYGHPSTTKAAGILQSPGG